MNGEVDDQRPVSLVMPRLTAFLSAMDAFHELREYIAQNRKELSSIGLAFARAAKKVYPGVSAEIHAQAGRVIHARVHEHMDAVASFENAVGSAVDEQRAQLDREFSQGLREALNEITGDPNAYYRYHPVWARIQQRSPGARILTKSIFISAVSDFEVLVSGLVRAFFKLRPEIMRAGDKTYSIADLEAFSSLDEFREHCAETMAESLLRGGFDEWMDWFDRRQGLQVPGVTQDAETLAEIFQRRHLLVHNGGVVNRFYLAKVSGGERPELGERLIVDGDYLAQAIDELTVAGVKLAVLLMLKLTSDKAGRDEIDHRLGHVTYEFLGSGSWAVAERLNEWHLTFVGRSTYRLRTLVNKWIAQKNAYGVDRIRSEVEAWETDTLSGEYRLAKLALLDQNEEAYSLLKSLLASGDVQPESWRDWPLLEGLRQYEASDVDPAERLSLVAFNGAHEDEERGAGTPGLT